MAQLINLAINPVTRIFFEFKPEEIGCCSEIGIWFSHNNETILLSDDLFKDNCYVMQSLLRNALNNKLPLKTSINNDFGFYE